MSPSDADPLRALGAVAGGGGAWLVGGAVRDRLLGRSRAGGAGRPADFDVVVAGDPEPLARAVARTAGGHAFELSEAFGAWRVVARSRRWQLDLLGLDGASLSADLARRDLTVNAIAEPLGGGEDPSRAPDGATPSPDRLIDPFGGLADLRARRLRMVSDRSFVEDPLRVLRLARLAAGLGFTVEPATVAHARRSAPGLASVAPERAFAELRELVCGDGALPGLALMDELGATAVLLPELAALDGVSQSAYHHLDVGAHTRAVLAETIALTADPAGLGIDDALAAGVSDALAQPLANELTRGHALRFGALLHDIAKPRTRAVNESGRVTFMGHDALGAEMAREILGRLRAADRLRGHVAALTRHHLALGFLVHRVPLDRRKVFAHLQACQPVGLDVTLLSVADRLATRGRGAQAAIARHLELARTMLGEALVWEQDPPRPPIRGDALAAALHIPRGPALGALLAELTAAAYAGEVDDEADAVAWARRRRAADAG